MRSLILGCILALLPHYAFAEVSVIGRYECTVKTTQLMIMEDGVAQKYSGYENETGVGDKLIFEIEKLEIGNYKSLKYRLTNTKLPNTFLVLGLVVNPAFNEETKTIGDGADPDHFDNRIEEDFMSFNYRRLSLNRYFKTDY